MSKSPHFLLTKVFSATRKTWQVAVTLFLLGTSENICFTLFFSFSLFHSHAYFLQDLMDIQQSDQGTDSQQVAPTEET